MLYADDLKVKEAQAAYFRNSGFDEGTYTDRWVRLPVRGWTLYLPNIGPRRRAVKFHDIDHVLTEYPTDWLGEWQISSYELGTGCGRHWVAWLINMQGILGGAFRAPHECIDAFARGRRSRGVYHFPSHELLLLETIGDLRKQTTAPAGSYRATLLDAIGFYSFVFASVFLHLLPLVLIGALILKI